MSETAAPAIDPNDIETVHNPASPQSDYQTTWWEAKPKPYSESVAKYVLGGMFRMRPKT
jgi:hypothetical protein